MVCDEIRGKFARTISASRRIGHVDNEGSARCRLNDHMNESKKYQEKSYSHNYCPDENCTQAKKSLKRGNFQDLSFVSCLRFEEINKSKIRYLFHWIEDMINYFNIRKPVE